METQIVVTPSLPTFFTIFLCLYLFAYYVVFRNWGPKRQAEASSCLVSLAHGTPAVLLAIYGLRHTQSPPTFASPNTTSQNIALEFSTAYFILDLLHYLVFVPSEILFILHHLATLYVITTCRYVVRNGAYAILVLLVLAEVTSCCQNVWILSSFRKTDVPMAAKLHEFLTPRFYAFYSVFRGILGPLFVFKMGVFYASGEADASIPKWAWISWTVVIGSAILVSISWILNHWIDWHRERSYKSQKKLR